MSLARSWPVEANVLHAAEAAGARLWCDRGTTFISKTHVGKDHHLEGYSIPRNIGRRLLITVGKLLKHAKIRMDAVPMAALAGK